jgi:lysophospholipase L1-like esterase
LNAPRQFSRKGQVFGTLVLLVVSIGVALLLAEFAVRFIHRDITTTGDNKSFFARKWYREQPPIVNALGFREDEISEKRAGIYRIAIIGDSLTYGQGILDNDRFSNLLRSGLNDNGETFEVFNFGRPGAETHHHRQILAEAVLPQKPDFILLQWFVNDVEISHAERGATAPLIPWIRLNKVLHQRSALYYLVNRQFASLQRSLGHAEDYVENMKRRFGDPSTTESKTAANELVRLIETISENDIPMGIVLFPLLVDVQGDAAAYPLGFLIDRVLVTCSEHEMVCLDLRHVFAPVTPTSDLWVNRYDKHPSAIANELATDAIRDRFAPIWLAESEL